MNKPELVTVSFKLNGKKVEAEIPPGRTLLEMLRRDLGLVATKEGCAKGECGACTVIFNGKTLNSCLKLAAQLLPEDEVVTLEGIEKDPLAHRVQKAFVEEGAVQCGFCTPGMVVSSYVLLKETPRPTEEHMKEALSGNLCRCTGYSKIIKAVKRASEE